eukprot:scaffold115233_cov57-Phaeocystis_antarctica.AAC.1
MLRDRAQERHGRSCWGHMRVLHQRGPRKGAPTEAERRSAAHGRYHGARRALQQHVSDRAAVPERRHTAYPLAAAARLCLGHRRDPPAPAACSALPPYPDTARQRAGSAGAAARCRPPPTAPAPSSAAAPQLGPTPPHCARCSPWPRPPPAATHARCPDRTAPPPASPPPSGRPAPCPCRAPPAASLPPPQRPPPPAPRPAACAAPSRWAPSSSRSA